MGVWKLNEEEIVRTYADTVYKIAYRYTANAADAEDVFSETFLAYFKRKRSFESEEHRKAWIIRVTINCAKDLLSARHNDEELNEELVGGEDHASREDILTLRQAIDALPPQQKEILTLYYLNDVPIKTIAEILNKNENTVKVTLFRARDNLRAYFEG